MSRKHANPAVPDAVRWFLRLRDKDISALSPEETAKWVTWAADDTHLDEFCRAKRLWRNLGALSSISSPAKKTGY
jgi:ferric-dicitrate binding protein FerR (iron transport regulator)